MSKVIKSLSNREQSSTLDPPGTPPGGSLQRTIIERFGRSVISGQWEAGTVLNMDDLALEHGVSRSVIREAVGVLTNYGLLESRKRRGTIVLESSAWNAFAPDVIAWRLDDPQQRDEQFRSLVELRMAIEPVAAYLAAYRIDPEQGKQLISVAEKMIELGASGRLDRFLEADLLFHQILLQGSNNDLFLTLNMFIEEILAGRHRLGRMPFRTDPGATDQHLVLAKAIAHGDPLAARAACTYIVEQAAEELNLADPTLRALHN
ncbi:MAG: FadR/GntR family transcriptional regulator [Actinomycetaceae bacterium]|nr:FadR/GntR family transcriptional regulator [Actinomycetaceae bacterium]